MQQAGLGSITQHWSCVGIILWSGQWFQKNQREPRPTAAGWSRSQWGCMPPVLNQSWLPQPLLAQGSQGRADFYCFFLRIQHFFFRPWVQAWSILHQPPATPSAMQGREHPWGSQWLSFLRRLEILRLILKVFLAFSTVHWSTGRSTDLWLHSPSQPRFLQDRAFLSSHGFLEGLPTAILAAAKDRKLLKTSRPVFAPATSMWYKVVKDPVRDF